MKLEINDNNLKIPYVADSLISRKCYKLERMLNKFSPDSIMLLCECNPASRKKYFQCSLELKVPEGGINVSAVEKSIVGAAGSAFKKLFRSVSQLKATMRSQSEDKEKSNLAQEALRGTVLNDEARLKLAEFYSIHYGEFYNYTLREIRFRTYQGYRKLGSVDVGDVLDEALLQMAAKFNQEYDGEKLRRLYYREIQRTLSRNFKRGGVALVPVEQPIEPEDIDTDYQEYYQPDEIIKVEDILIDADSILPEERVEYKEIEDHIDKLLAQLPEDWRNALILSAREGVPVKDLARNKGMKTKDMQKIIENAKNFIHQKLQDSGFDWKQ